MSPSRVDSSVNPVRGAYRVNAMPLRKSWRWIGAFGPDVMLCVAHARVGVLRRSWWAVWDGTQLHEGTRAPFELALEAGRADRGHHRPGLDAQDAAARDAATVLGPRDRPAGPARRVPRPSRAADVVAVVGGRGRHRGRRPGDLEPRRRHAPGREHRVGRRRRRTVVDPPPFDGIAGVGDLRFTALATRAKQENYLVHRLRLRAAVRHVHRHAADRRDVAAGHGVMERHEAW